MASRTTVYYNGIKSAQAKVEVITASKTLNAADTGKIFGLATDALVVTLPAVSGVATGTNYTFVNTAADGGAIIRLSPAAADGIFGTVSNAAADSVASGVDGKDFVNTKATANKGDRITLVKLDATGWYITDGVGIWASEA
jgi:hypothetical protein